MTTKLSFSCLRALSVGLTSRLLTVATLTTLLLVGATSQGKGDGPEPPPSGSSSSESDASNGDSFPGYRFWKAPVDSIDHWPWGTEKYYPIKIDRFNKWIDVTDEIARLSEEDMTVRGVAPSLTLEARLSDDSLIGVGEFSTAPVSSERTDAQEEAESTPYLLRPFSFATSPYSSDEKVDLMEAIGAYADGRFYLPNSKAASRKFFWSQRGTLDRRDRLTFDLRFPNSLRTELKLIAPYDVTIEAINGVATEISSDLGSDEQGVSRSWRVYFGSRPQAVLRATRGADNAFPKGSRKVGVRQESSYRMTREGLELNARLEFERLSNRPQEIVVFLDKRLRLVSAEWGSVKDLNLQSTSSDDQFNKIVIKTPGQLETLDDLKLTAFGPVELDKTTSLPPLTFEEDSAFYWRETTLRLAVVRPLVVSTSRQTDALPFREAFRARQEGVEVLSYKLNNPKGNVALKVCSYEKTPPFDSATDCLIAADAVSAKTTLFYSFSGVESSNVTIPIAPDWSIRSVSSLSDDLISWSFEDGDEPESESRNLSVSFRKTPPSDRPVKIDVSARMVKTDADAPIDVDKLCPIDLTNNLRGAHALALRAESPYQIKLTTRSGRPYTAPNAEPNFVFSELALRDATPASSGVKRLYFGTQTVDAAASLENLRSTYTTTGSCLCEFYGTLAPDNYVEKWNVRCEPLGGSSVDRVVFYVPGAQEGTKAYNSVWKWSSSLDPDRLNTATRLSEEDAKLYRVPENTAAYEMRLPTLASSAFDLIMTCEDTFSKRFQPFLAIFPESSNSTLEFVVDSPQGFRFDTHFVNMRETTAPVAVDGKYESLKKAFRYESNSRRRDSDAERKMKDSELDVDGNNEQPPGSENVDPELTVSFEDSVLYGFNSENALPPSARCWLERLDSFFQSNGKSRNRALFYLENRGRLEFELKLPQNVGETAIRDVWIDGRSSTYGFIRDRRSIVLQLPLDRRFVCVTVEYDAPCERLAGGERLTPSRLACDAPVLSGEWNVWTPPQYQTRFGATRDRIDERVGNLWAQSLFSFIALGASERRIEELSNRFLERLGNTEALAAAVSESKKLSSEPGASSAPRSGAGNGALTWGDVVGDPLVVNWLFAPLTKSVAQTDDESRPTIGTKTPFGVLDASSTFNLYIDRIAAAYASLTPSTPIPNSALTSYDSRARQIIEDSKFALVFIDESSAVLTTRSVLNRRFDFSIAPVGGRSVFRVVKASDARKARAELSSNSRRFIASQEWRDAEATVSPWRNPPQDEFAVGWNRTNVSLSRAESGVRVVNRYFLWALELFCFIGYIALLWRFNLAGIRFCVGSLGACAAALNVVTFEWFAATVGVAYGALLVLCFLLFFPRDALRRANRSGAKRVRKDRRSDDKILEVEFSDQADASSTEGFVDFDLMPSEERRRLKGVDQDDESSIPARPDELRPGKISMKTTIALTLATLLLFSFAKFASTNAQDSTTAPAPATNLSEASDESDSNGETTWREPYRVFVPIDGEGKTVGDYYWVGEEFYDSIRATLDQTPRERNWRVVDARYEGSVNYNASLGATTLFNLKATYTVVLDSTSATIVLPALPLAPDVGAKFDRQTISSSFNEQSDELYFNPYDVEPGEHTLELTLVPPQFSETNTLLSLPVLRSPSARLELSVSMDAPALDVPNAMGKVTRSAGWLVAELGSVDRLMLSIQESSDYLARGSVDVEQLFLARPRSTQLDVRAVFRRQTPGKKIKTLEIECDPSYSFSGTCQYDEGEIENVEPPTDQNNVLRVTFKEPTTGPFTLNVGFIARNFSGVGSLQFPRISVRDVRALRNWFAVSPGPDVEFSTEPEFVRSSTLDAFKKAWGTVDDTIISAYDLAALPLDASFSIGAKVSQLQIDTTTTCVFDVSETQTRCDALINAPNDLFRLSVKTPLPFNVDSVSLTDERGTELEQPDYFMTEDVLTLVFQSPVKGRVNLQIVGRTKTAQGDERAFPTFVFLSSDVGRRFARLYRAPSVFFEWNDSKGWLKSENSDAPGVGKEPTGDYRFVGFYEFVDDSERASLRALDLYSYEIRTEEPDVVDEAVGGEATCVVRRNAPQFVGVEETALYHELNSPLWQAKVYFRFSVESGVADRFLILDDEAYSWEIEDLESRFDVAEATSYAGARAIALTPKKELGNQIDVRLNATFKNDPDAVRLPKFQLLPSSPREDVSGVERYVALPERKMTDRQNERLNWATQDLREVVDDAKKSSVNNATSSMMSSIVKESTPEVDKLKKELLGDVRNITGGLADYEFSFYFREPGASARLLSESASLSVSRARYSFYMNARYEYFGSASFMIRKSSMDYCTLVVPSSCELLEATVNGSRRPVDFVGADEKQSYWRVDLDTTPYVKRVEASFRGSSKTSSNVQAEYGSRRSPAFCADFVAIGEDVPETGAIRRVNPERVYWFCAFESLDTERMRWRVFERGEGEKERAPSKLERANAEREPVLWSDASDLLFRFCVENASALLEAYESDLSQLSGANADDLARLRAWWDLAWNENQSATAQFSETSEGVTERLRRAMFVVEKGRIASPENELADPTSRWGRAQYEETMQQKEKLDEAYPVDGDATSTQSTYLASPQSLWTYDAGVSTSLLFGVSDGDARHLIVASTPKSFDFFASHYSTAAFILVLTAFFMSFLKRGAKRSAFGSFYVGVFVAVWTVVFFLLDRKQIGLLGALIFSVGPAAVASLARRYRARFNKEEPEPVEEDGSTIEPDLLARKMGRELSTTETLERAVSSEDSPGEDEFAPGSETQLENPDDETSFEEQFD